MGSVIGAQETIAVAGVPRRWLRGLKTAHWPINALLRPLNLLGASKDAAVCAAIHLHKCKLMQKTTTEEITDLLRTKPGPTANHAGRVVKQDCGGYEHAA